MDALGLRFLGIPVSIELLVTLFPLVPLRVVAACERHNGFTFVQSKVLHCLSVVITPSISAGGAAISLVVMIAARCLGSSNGSCCGRGNGRLLANLCDVRSLGFDTADYQCTVPFRHDPYCALIVARSTALGVFSADDAEGGGGINDVDRLLVS